MNREEQGSHPNGSLTGNLVLPFRVDQGAESCLAQKMDHKLEIPCALLVPRVQSLREGSKIVGDIIIGKELGRGVQARVFELIHENEQPTGKVLKLAHQDLGHRAINAVWINMEREWEVATQLRAALQNEDGSLPGFMKVCDCIVASDVSGHQRKPGKVHFAGMILEKLNGWEVYKRIDTPEFHNIHFVRNLLFHVFIALDKGQKETGFHHADLAPRNIMEHYPTVFEPSHPQNKKPGWNCARDGSRYPLGQHIEYKIIDYGSSYFSDTLAQSTGGYRARFHWAELRTLFQAKHDAYHDAGAAKEGSMEMASRGNGTHRRQLQLVPTSIRNRFRIKSASPSPPSSHHEQASSPIDHLPPVPLPKNMGLIEKMYRRYWRRKGDVYHLLLNLALILDDRVWHKIDEEEVQLFVSLVHHVCGVKMKASFMSDGESDNGGDDNNTYDEERAESMRCFAWGKKQSKNRRAGGAVFGAVRNTCAARFRKMRIRLEAHMFPYNSGLTAAEALVAPFFHQPDTEREEGRISLNDAFERPQ